MEWTDSWTVANSPRGGDSLVPQTMHDNLFSPTAKSVSLPPFTHNTKFDAGAVSDWLETAALDSSDFSLDGGALEHGDREFRLRANCARPPCAIC